MAHIEIVGAMCLQLSENADPEEIKAAGFDSYFVDHGTGVYPCSASGVPFNAACLASKGDPITDLNEDLAAEQKARTTYLYEAVLCLETVEECRLFFKDLCTIPELKALSQRFQVAKMLTKDHVYSDIVNETGASTATISRVNRSLSYDGSGGYNIVFDRLDKKEDK